MGFFDRIRGRRQPVRPWRLDPVNRLEDRLQDVVLKVGEIEDFVGELVRSQVFVLTQGDPAQVPPGQARPLVLPGSDGYSCLCIFTHPDRAIPIQEEHPDYKLGLLVAFSWILERTPQGLGLIVNPGWDLTVEQRPDGLDQLRQACAAGRWSTSAR